MDWTQIATTATTIAVALVGSTALNTWVAGRVGRKKVDADAAKVEAEAQTQLATTMLAWQQTLTARITLLESAVNQCHADHITKDNIIADLRVRVTSLEGERDRLTALQPLAAR